MLAGASEGEPAPGIRFSDLSQWVMRSGEGYGNGKGSFAPLFLRGDVV